MNPARRARLRVVAVALGLGLVALVTSSCGPAATPAPAGRTAGVTSAADCLAPQVLDQLGLTLDPSLAARTSHPAAPEPGRVPDDFVASSVLVCQVGGQMRDGQGTWTAVSATTREGSAADVAALVGTLDDEIAATGSAPVPATTGPPAACSTHGTAEVVWLLDAIDRAVRPAVPVDGCGSPEPALRAALERLPVTGVVDYPVALVAPSPSPTPTQEPARAPTR